MPPGDTVKRLERKSHLQQAVNNSQVAAPNTPDMETDVRVLPSVPEYLSRGLDLLHWWREVESRGGPEQQFPLERSVNRPNRSFGFYGEAPVSGSMMPVMGNVQEMFYDQTRSPAALELASSEWMWAQIREFAMKYFMRVSSFREPEAHVDSANPIPPPALSRLSWCPTTEEGGRKGFGFCQMFYKLVGSDQVQAFPSFEQFAIVDQRELGRKYEWIVLKVRIFDFNVSVRLFDKNGPELVFGANEQSYLVSHPEFINYKERHIPGVLGDYGIGYAFIKSPVEGPFGYGPGEFDAAIELINFRMYETGYISVRMVFVANRPTQIANLTVDPVSWGFDVADAFSFGLASRLLSPAKDLLDQLPLRFRMDPVSAYVSGANMISGGAAAQTLCISIEQLEKFFLLQHFKQHYQTIVGSLLTWRQIPDWLDEKNLPPWVISGISA
jgi:hypothetical protein